MADDETTDAPDDADATTDEAEVVDASDQSAPPKERSGVFLPAWAVAALVVVAALAIGGTGYAIGHSGEDSINLNSPIAALRQAPGTGDDEGHACPGPMDGRDGERGELPRPGSAGVPGIPGFGNDDQ